MAIREPHLKVDGQVLASVKHWHPPRWIEQWPFKFFRNSNRFLVAIRRFGSYGNDEILSQSDVIDLLTNGGRDWMHAMVYTNTNSSQASQGGNFMALTTDTAAANATDTTLASELTRSDLARKIAGTLTHSAGSSTTSLVASWTATASQAGLVKGALFNASAAGTMSHEGTYTSATLATNDVFQLTFNTSLG